MASCNVCSNIVRRKPLSEVTSTETKLKRCLTTNDITLVALCHMLGGGIYVVAGRLVKSITGPAVIISFFLAGVGSFFTALCFAEFGSWVPRAGSAYTYTYTTMGEIWAFLTGWNIIIEHMIGSSTVARTFSIYVDDLTGRYISNHTINIPEEYQFPFLSKQVDFLAGAACIATTMIVASGAKQSVVFKNTLVFFSLLVIVFIVGYGMYFANFDYWFSDKYGGFAPFGIRSIADGASEAFISYVGFTAITVCAEEMLTPAKTIPISTFLSLTIVTLIYVAMTATLTLMVPYYEVDEGAAFTSIFRHHGVYWAKYVVSAGAICGIAGSLAGRVFSLPRIIYAMACDGLLFRCLSRVSTITQVPSWATLLSGALATVLSMILDTGTLVDILSMGTLSAASMVTIGVLMLRYVPSQMDPALEDAKSADCRRMAPKWLVYVALLTFIFGTIASNVIMIATDYTGDILFTVLFGVSLAATLSAFVMLCLFRPQPTENLTFKVPLSPLLPCLGFVINITLISHLPPATFAKVGIWMLIGIFVYFSYGYHHSSEHVNEFGEKWQEDDEDMGCCCVQQIIQARRRRKSSVKLMKGAGGKEYGALENIHEKEP